MTWSVAVRWKTCECSLLLTLMILLTFLWIYICVCFIIILITIISYHLFNAGLDDSGLITIKGLFWLLINYLLTINLYKTINKWSFGQTKTYWKKKKFLHHAGETYYTISHWLNISCICVINMILFIPQSNNDNLS